MWFYIQKLHMSNQILQIEQGSYQALIEHIRDYAIVLLDTSGNIISWNKGAEQIYG